MVNIKRGEHILTVSMGAYRNVYKAMGYSIVGAEEGHKAPSAPARTHVPSMEKALTEDSAKPDTDDEGEDLEDDEPQEEKPLGEMDMDELVAYADRLGIDHEGVRYKKDMRALIREYLNS